MDKQYPNEIHERGRGRFAVTVILLVLGTGVLAGIGAAGTGTSPENVGFAALGTAAIIYMSGWSIDLFSRMHKIENYYNN